MRDRVRKHFLDTDKRLRLQLLQAVMLRKSAQKALDYNNFMRDHSNNIQFRFDIQKWDPIMKNISSNPHKASSSKKTSAPSQSSAAHHGEYAALSLRDLLEARDYYHVHLMRHPNVIATAIGFYRIRVGDLSHPLIFQTTANV